MSDRSISGSTFAGGLETRLATAGPSRPAESAAGRSAAQTRHAQLTSALSSGTVTSVPFVVASMTALRGITNCA